MSYDTWKTTEPPRECDLTPPDDDVVFCRACRGLLNPTDPQVQWNGWDWCPECVPEHVTAGLMAALKADERRDDQ